MLALLLEGHETLARACRTVFQLCQDAEDTATEDFINGRIAAHDKAAWILRGSLPR